MPENNRQDAVASPITPSRPFATPGAGDDYFASEAHYASLARRIVAGLRGGPRLVLVIGDPPPNPLLLSPALRNVAARGCAVIAIACGPEFSRDLLLRASSPPTAAAVGGLAAEQPESAPSLSPLCVFDDADRLSDGQIENILEILGAGNGTPAGVLLARPAFFTRLQRLNPHIFTEGLATRVEFQELDREEIEPFIRRQLPPGEETSGLTAEAITSIADFSGGDPIRVKGLSRLMLEFADAANSKGRKDPIGAVDQAKAPRNETVIGTSPETVDTGSSGTARVVTRSERPPQGDASAEARSYHAAHHRRRAWSRRIVILLCPVVVGLFIVSSDNISSLVDGAAHHIAAFGAPDLGAWNNPLRDNVFPRMTRNVPLAAGASPRTAAATIVPAEETAPTPPTSSDVPNTALALVPATKLPPAETPTAEPTAPSSAAPLNESPLSAAEIAALVARGDAFVSLRDIATARLFYERAVEAGDGRAALRIGATYDPAFLDRAGIRGEAGHQQEALYWYRRARDLGNAQAERRLKDFAPQ